MRESSIGGLANTFQRLWQIAENHQRLDMTGEDEVRSLTELRNEMSNMIGYMSQVQAAESKAIAAAERLVRILQARKRDDAGDASRIEQELGAGIRAVEEEIAWRRKLIAPHRTT